MCKSDVEIVRLVRRYTGCQFLGYNIRLVKVAKCVEAIKCIALTNEQSLWRVAWFKPDNSRDFEDI